MRTWLVSGPASSTSRSHEARPCRVRGTDHRGHHVRWPGYGSQCQHQPQAHTVRPAVAAALASGCPTGVKWARSGNKWSVEATSNPCGVSWRAEAYCYSGSHEWTGYGTTYTRINVWSVVNCKSGYTLKEGLFQWNDGTLHTVALAYF